MRNPGNFRIEAVDNGYVMHCDGGPSVDDPLGQRGTRRLVFESRVDLFRHLEETVPHPKGRDEQRSLEDIDIIYSHGQGRAVE